MGRVKQWFGRWQEFAGWLPGLVLLSLVAWVFFGALDRRLGTDALAFLLELPIRTAYALAALGLAHLALRRQRRKLGNGEQADLWLAVRRGERGAVVIYLGDLFAWAFTFGLSIAFFWPAR